MRKSVGILIPRLRIEGGKYSSRKLARLCPVRNEASLHKHDMVLQRLGKVRGSSRVFESRHPIQQMRAAHLLMAIENHLLVTDLSSFPYDLLHQCLADAMSASLLFYIKTLQLAS